MSSEGHAVSRPQSGRVQQRPRAEYRHLWLRTTATLARPGSPSNSRMSMAPTSSIGAQSVTVQRRHSPELLNQESIINEHRNALSGHQVIDEQSKLVVPLIGAYSWLGHPSSGSFTDELERSGIVGSEFELAHTASYGSHRLGHIRPGLPRPRRSSALLAEQRSGGDADAE